MENIPYVSKIESMGWSLYDVSDIERSNESWESRGLLRATANAVELGHTYLFAPQPDAGMTLRQAYSTTMGIGPCLRINDINSPEYKALALKFSPRLAVFTRFVLSKSEVIFYTPSTAAVPQCDYVILQPVTAQVTFERDFDVISTDDFSREVHYGNLEWRTTGS